MVSVPKEIARFTDEDGRLIQLPRRMAARLCAFEHLMRVFAPSREYTEPEVNALLDAAATFGDACTLRRELVEGGYLCRTRDCTRYWVNEAKQNKEDIPSAAQSE